MGDLAVPKCPNCGALLSVAATDTTVQCAYCGRRSAVRRPGFGPPPPFGTAPSPPPFQPGPAPPPFGQPYGAPAPLAPGPMPARSGSGGAMLMVLIAALGVLIAGGVAAMVAFNSSGAHHGASKERDGVEDTPVASPGADDGTRSAGATATKPAAANLFEKPAGFVTTVEEARGQGVKLKQIVIHKTHAVVTVQEAGDALARQVYRAGTLTPFGPPPRLSKRDKRQLDKLLFSLGQVDFDKLPSLAIKAVERLGWQGAEISHIVIEHGTPFANKVLIRVYVKSPTENGRVEYDLQGREHRVYR